jgi:hypothetical protein
MYWNGSHVDYHSHAICWMWLCYECAMIPMGTFTMSDHLRGHVLSYCFAGSSIRKYETNSPFREHLVVVVLMTGTTHE